MPTANGDTSKIDEVIAYLESPEYLRQTARAQGESPLSLLSGSRTQPWQSSDVRPQQGDESFPITPGCVATVLEDSPWFSGLLRGDVVRVTSEIQHFVRVTSEIQHSNLASGPWVDVADQRGTTWSVPISALRADGTELSRWEPEVLGFRVAQPEAESTPVPSAAPVSRPATRQRRRRSGSVQQLITRDSFYVFRDVMDACQSFKTYGSLRGKRFADMRSPEAGHLPSALADRFRTAWINGRVSYVVYSYNTPIAWAERDISGPSLEWVIPLVRYSRTTSRHQSKIRAAASASLLDAVRYVNEDGITVQYPSNDL